VSAILETVISYVPRLAIRRKLADPTPLKGPEIEGFPAAVLLADVSGFTALTETLAQRGPEGAEDMTRAINSYFGRLIDIIQAHGGDIVKFAGDAMLILWPVLDESTDLTEQTLRAAECGLSLQRQVGTVETIPGAPLSLHAAVGAGDMALAQLGGVFGRWESVVMGPALAGMADAAHLSKNGEVVSTPEAWAQISAKTRGTSLEHDCVRLEDINEPPAPRPLPVLNAPQAVEGALKSFLPGAVKFRMEAGQADWLAELRPVTVLFVNLPDLGHDTPIERAQELMQVLQTSTYRFEGSINKLSVDEKGVSLVAALGLPPLSHYDDSPRGVGVALTIKEKLDAMGIRCSIGVASGRAFCGEVGNQHRREYTIMGDVVNLAARLMQAARGGICCDVTTQLASKSSYDFEALPAIPLKGKTGLFAIFKPLAKLRKRLPSEVRLVGRTAERIAIGTALQTLRESRETWVLLIEGEAGIGKSALLGYAAAQATALRCKIMSGSADAVEQQTPYLSWRHVLTELFGIADDDDPDTRRNKVVARLELRLEEVPLAPLLNTMLPLDFPETEFTTHLDAQVRARMAHDLLCRQLREAAAMEPLVVILDDVHWMDSASWSLAKTVTQKVQSVLLILASRPLGEKPPAELEAMLAGGGKAIRPTQMSSEEVGTLVCQRLGVDHVPEELEALIAERTGGHPLFVEEVAYTLRDSGALIIEGGNCSVGDLRNLNLPGTVQGVITSRIDRLPPGEQLTLKLAACIGRIFDPRILGAIHPLEEVRKHIANHLETFASSDLTSREIVDNESVEAFKSAVIRDVAYSLLLFAQRKEVHRSIAEWYERECKNDLASNYPLLAHHWAMADVPEKAADYLEKAGQTAVRSFAYKEAADQFSRALEFEARLGDSGDPHRKLRIHQFLGQVFKGMGRQEEAKDVLTQALDSSRALGDHNAEARVLSSLGHMYSLQGHKELALETLGQAIAKCREVGNGQELLRALQFLARYHYRLGNPVEATRRSEEGIEAARTWPEPLDASVHQGFLGMLYVTVNVPDMEISERMWKGVALLQEAVATKRKVGDKLNLNDTLNLLGNAQWVLGAYRDAIETFEETLRISIDTGIKYDETCARINLAIQCHEMGDFHGMFRHAERAYQDAKAGGYIDYSSIAVYLLALADTYLGKPAAGAAHGAIGDDLMTKLSESARPGIEATVLPYIAERQLLVGRIEEGLATAQLAWQRMEETGVREYEHRLMTLLGEAFYRQGKLPEARERFEGARDLGLQTESPGSLARAYLGLALLAHAESGVDAVAKMREALKYAEEVGSRQVTAEIKIWLGAWLAEGGQGEESLKLLDEALHLGMDASSPHYQTIAHYGLSKAKEGDARVKHLRWADMMLSEQVGGMDPDDVRVYEATAERRGIRDALLASEQLA
jgi:class 3 adenylate cyclase/tetratricopeptide (TPR) repeat protein